MKTMKHILLAAASLLILASCNPGGSEGYKIMGSLRGEVADGTQVILRKSDENFQTVDVDTTTVTAGEFLFTGTAAEPELHYVYIEGLRGGIPLILENGSIELEAHKDSLQQVAISGTPQNDSYAEYLKGARELADLRASMNEDLRAAMMGQDSAVILSLRDEFFELQDRMTNFEKDFASEHPDALITGLILDRMLESGAVPIGEVDALYKGLSPELRSSKLGQGIQQKLEVAGRTAIGSKAPEFSGPTPDGTELSLREAMGKVTLIDFWAGWCRPCRAENPNIVAVYNKYKDKGLKVLGVSLDRNAEEWKKAIADDGLTWNHVSHVAYFDDEIALLYNIRAIPASFILDENGVIVAKDLRGPELEAKIAELLP